MPKKEKYILENIKTKEKFYTLSSYATEAEIQAANARLKKQNMSTQWVLLKKGIEDEKK